MASSSVTVHGAPAARAWPNSALQVLLPDPAWPISVSEGGHSFQWDATGAIFRHLALLPVAGTVVDCKSPQCHAGLKRASPGVGR